MPALRRWAPVWHQRGGALWLADAFVTALPESMSSGTGLCIASSLFTGVLTNFMSDGATVSAIGPITVPMASISGTHPWAVGFATAFASSFANALIIGTPNNAIAYSLAKDSETGEQLVSLGDFFKHGVVITVLSLLVLWGWAFMGYWKWIGFLNEQPLMTWRDQWERNIQLLIVDDEERFLKTLTERLAMRDFDVTPCSNGADALKLADERDFDVALVDLKMPGMSGEEVLEALKQKHPLTEVVILTGHGSIDSAIRCTEVGSYHYLQKPCETTELMQVLKNAYQRRVQRHLKLDQDKMDKLLNLAMGESPLAILRKLKEIDEKGA